MVWNLLAGYDDSYCRKLLHVCKQKPFNEFTSLGAGLFFLFRAFKWYGVPLAIAYVPAMVALLFLWSLGLGGGI